MAQESGRAPSTAIAESAEHGQPVLYQKGSDLQETLLATRQRYAAWLAEQPAVRKAVEFGAWLATPPLPADQAEKLVRPGENLDPNAKLPDGRAPLVATEGPGRRPSGQVRRGPGGHGGPPPANDPRRAAGEADGRHRRRRAPGRLAQRAPGRLRADAPELRPLRVRARSSKARASISCWSIWICGRARTRCWSGCRPAASRRSTSRRRRIPCPRFWEQVRRDFPAAQNPLLELVHADWFDARGWFAAAGSQFEEQLIDRLAADCGGDEAALRAELKQLQAGQGRSGRPPLAGPVREELRCWPRSAAIWPGSARRSRNSATRTATSTPPANCWRGWTTARGG